MSNIPVLLLIYNRPGYTKRLIANLKKTKPRIIYIFCDGPKNIQDKVLCQKAINETLKINWKCFIKKKTLKKNLGCKEAVSRAINWFFNYNKKGIILEDDCLPNKIFFKFCEMMLKYYYKNKNIGCITGDNFLSDNFKFQDNYYLSKYANCWGWATWRNRWNFYKKDINFWPKLKKSKKWNSNFLSRDEREYWSQIFDRCYENKIDSWAYPWTLSLWKNNLLTVTPAKNLVHNIGLSSSRNFFNFKNKSYKSEYLNLRKVKFNQNLKINKSADTFVFIKHFKGKSKLKFWFMLKTLRLYKIYNFLK